MRRPVLLGNKSFQMLVYRYLFWASVLWKFRPLADYCWYRKHTEVYCPDVKMCAEFHSLLWEEEGKKYFRF